MSKPFSFFGLFVVVLFALSACDMGLDDDISVGNFFVRNPSNNQLVASTAEADPGGTDMFIVAPVEIRFDEPEVTGFSSGIVSYYLYIAKARDWRNLSWSQRFDLVHTQRYLLGVSEYSSGESQGLIIEQDLDEQLIKNILDAAVVNGRIAENSYESYTFPAFTWNIVAEVTSAVPGSAPLRVRATSPDRTLSLWPGDSSFDLFK